MRARMAGRVGGAGAVGLALLLGGALLARAQQAPEQITIGVTLPLTGRFEAFYAVTDKFLKAWQDLVNEQGGIAVKEAGRKLPVKVIYYDDKSDPKTSVKFYEKLITDDKVQFLLGPMTSPMGFAGSTVAEKYHFPMLLTTSVDNKIYERGYKWIQCTCGLATEWSDSYFEMHGKLRQAKSIVFVTEDTLYAQGVKAGAAANAKQAGIATAYERLAPPETEDFTPIIAQLKAANADIVYVSSFAPFGVKFAKQAKELGLRPRSFHYSTGTNVNFRRPMGPDADGITSEAIWAPGLRLGKRWQLHEAVAKRSGVDLEEWPYMPYVMVGLEALQEAIEQTGTLNRGRVFQAIQTMKLKTTSGPYQARPNGVGSINPMAVQFQGGKMVVVWPSNVATGKYVYPSVR